MAKEGKWKFGTEEALSSNMQILRLLLLRVRLLIERFSEDIDIAINPAKYGMIGDLTKKQLKIVRKRSLFYVKEVLAPALQDGL